jgi:hypothetical protein
MCPLILCSFVEKFLYSISEIFQVEKNYYPILYKWSHVVCKDTEQAGVPVMLRTRIQEVLGSISGRGITILPGGLRGFLITSTQLSG